MPMVVNETKLNAAMTATADAIRAKTGDSAQIPFDYNGGTGFADAVEAIPQGGGGATVTIKPLASNGPNLTNTSFEGIDTLIVDATGYSDWSGNARADGMRKLVVIDPSNRANRTQFFRTSDIASKTIEEIEFIGSTSNATNMSFMFYGNSKLKRIIGEIDFSSATNVSNVLGSCRSLEEVRFVPNTLNIDLMINTYISTVVLSNESLISLANCLSSSVSGKTLKVDRPYYLYIPTIMGYNDNGLFVKSEDGTLSLSDFITNIKGWTLGVA